MGKAETKETKLQEIEVLNAEQIMELDVQTQDNIIFLSENLHGSELVKLNPIVNKVLNLRTEVANLRAEKKDGEITKDCIKQYKSIKAELRSLGGTITSEFKEMKKPYNKIGKGLVAIEKEFRKIKEELEAEAQEEFKEYEEEKKRKAEEAQAKKDAELKAEMDKANEQAEAEREKRERSEAMNKIKYELITEGIGERAEQAVEKENEDALGVTYADIAQKNLSTLMRGVSNSHLITPEQQEDLEAHLAKTKKRALKLVEDRLDKYEEEREQIRKEASAPPPPPPARNEDVAPADPDVPTGNTPDQENVESFMKIDIQRTTPEEHAKKVLNYIQGLQMSVKLRIEEEGPHPALINLIERFNKFNS